MMLIMLLSCHGSKLKLLKGNVLCWPYYSVASAYPKCFCLALKLKHRSHFRSPSGDWFPPVLHSEDRLLEQTRITTAAQAKLDSLIAECDAAEVDAVEALLRASSEARSQMLKFQVFLIRRRALPHTVTEFEHMLDSVILRQPTQRMQIELI